MGGVFAFEVCTAALSVAKCFYDLDCLGESDQAKQDPSQCFAFSQHSA
jgi:hypothetical protein